MKSNSSQDIISCFLTTLDRFRITSAVIDDYNFVDTEDVVRLIIYLKEGNNEI